MQVGQLPIDEQLAQFRTALGRNRTLMEVLARAVGMGLPGWYLVAGCLYQTIWNVVTGQPPEAGIMLVTAPGRRPPVKRSLQGPGPMRCC
jgi:uncharacterized protein